MDNWCWSYGNAPRCFHAHFSFTHCCHSIQYGVTLFTSVPLYSLLLYSLLWLNLQLCYSIHNFVTLSTVALFTAVLFYALLLLYFLLLLNSLPLYSLLLLIYFGTVCWFNVFSLTWGSIHHCELIHCHSIHWCNSIHCYSIHYNVALITTVAVFTTV